MRVALEDGERLRAGIVDARGAAHDLAEAPVAHLLLGAQEAFLVAAAVADAQLAFCLAQGVEDRIGVGEREADRLLHQHRQAARERSEDRLGVLLLGRRDDHRGHVGVVDHLVVAAAREIGARLLRQGARSRRVAIGDGEKAHRGMLGREPRPQGPDAAGPDHRDADVFGLLHLCFPGANVDPPSS